MKLSALHPCDSCGKQLTHGSHFYVVRASDAFVIADTANQVLGMMQYFQGNLRLAELFTPSEEAVLVAGDKEPKLMREFLICPECFLGKPIDFAVLIESEAKKGENKK